MKLELSANDEAEDGGDAVGEGDGDGGAWLDEPPLVSVVVCRCSPNNLPQVIDFNPPQFGSGEKASPVKEATEKAGPVKEAAEKALETGGEPVPPAECESGMTSCASSTLTLPWVGFLVALYLLDLIAQDDPIYEASSSGVSVPRLEVIFASFVTCF